MISSLSQVRRGKSMDFDYLCKRLRSQVSNRHDVSWCGVVTQTLVSGNILSNLDTLLDSLYSQISLICSESPRKELESNIWTAFGELFYSKVAALLLDTCIKDLTPLTYNEVLEFPKRIGSLCFNFEEKWAAKGRRSLTVCISCHGSHDVITGMIQNDKRPITEYCKNISFRFIKRKRDALLSETRSICLSRDYDYSIIEGHVIRDGTYLNSLYEIIDWSKELDGETVSEIDGLFVFPKCAISHKVAKTKELLESALNEMLEMDDSW